MLRSRPGPQATETMGSGTGKGRMTPFLTCPPSTRAPDRRVCPSRKNRASAPSNGLLAPLGVRSPLSRPRGLPRAPEPRSPPPPGAAPAPAAGNSSAGLAARPGSRRRVDRASRSPPHTRGSARRGAPPPPPTPKRGATAHVSPLAQSGPSLGLGAGGSGTSWSKARKGTRAGPLPLPRSGRGPGRRPLLRAPAPRFPVAERKLPPPPAGLTWGRGRGFELGPSPAFPPGSPSCTPNKVPRPQLGAGGGRAAVAASGWSRRRGLHLSVPAPGREPGDHSDLHPAPPSLRPPPSVRPGPLGPPLPGLLVTPPSAVGSSWAGAARSPRTPRPSRSTAEPREPAALPPVGILRPDFLGIPPFPAATPRPQPPGPALAGPLGPGSPEARAAPRTGAGQAEDPPPPEKPWERRLSSPSLQLARPPPEDPRVPASLSPPSPACQSVAANLGRVGRLPPAPHE